MPSSSLLCFALCCVLLSVVSCFLSFHLAFCCVLFSVMSSCFLLSYSLLCLAFFCVLHSVSCFLLCLILCCVLLSVSCSAVLLWCLQEKTRFKFCPMSQEKFKEVFLFSYKSMKLYSSLSIIDLITLHLGQIHV